MELLNLVQGSDEWLTARLDYACASEAPILFVPLYDMTREKLLSIKAGWRSNPVDAYKQKLFDEGHLHEEQARPIFQERSFCFFPPAVGLREVDGIKYLASFDGLESGKPGRSSWEHKDWNLVLSENVLNGVLEPKHYWQLEHQMLVNDGATSVHFTCSNGTREKCASMVYESVPERREQLKAAWKQFYVDLETHELKARKEIITLDSNIEDLPAFSYKTEGSSVICNVAEFLPTLRKRAEEEMNLLLTTDKDFADKAEFNKMVGKARKKLRDMKDRMLNEFTSLSEAQAAIDQADSILQKMFSHGERQVKEAKEKEKNRILTEADVVISEHCKKCNNEISPMRVIDIGVCDYNLLAAIKGKSKIESIQNAVNIVVAEVKAFYSGLVELAKPNIKYLQDNVELHERHLFQDAVVLVNQAHESFVAVVTLRLNAHREAEEKRKAEEREAIAKEEREKIQRENEEKERQAQREKNAEIAASHVDAPAVNKDHVNVHRPREYQTLPSEITDVEYHEVIEVEQASIDAVSFDSTTSLKNDLERWAVKHGMTINAIAELPSIINKYTIS